jgi:WD40 repeat protein
METRAVAFALLLAALSLPAPASAQDTSPDPEATHKAQLRPICADPAARAKIVVNMIEQGGEYEQATAKWDLDVACEQVDLSVTPTHDTADPSDDATHTNWIYDARWSPDGTLIATAGRDATVRIWDAATGKPIRRIDIAKLPPIKPDEQAGMVRSVRFLDGGRSLAVAADMHPIRVFDVESGEAIAELPFTHVDTVWLSAPFIEATPGGLVLIGGYGTAVAVYDWAARRERYHLPGTPAEYSQFAASEAAGVLATTAPAGERSVRVMLHKLDRGEKLWEAEMQGSRTADIVVFSRDGARLAVAVDGKAYIYETGTGKLVTALTVYPTFGSITLAFTADGHRLVAGVRHAQLWDIATGNRVLNYGPFSDLFHSVDVSPDGRYIVTGHMGSDGRIWEIGTGVFFRRLGKNVHPPG